MKQLNTSIIRVKDTDNEYKTLLALRGATSYEVAVQNGFKGTESEWVAMMVDDGWVTKYQELEASKAAKTELAVLENHVDTDFYNKKDILSDITRVFLDLNDESVPDDAFIKLFALHGSDIATGSYTGTDVSGSANPCVLTFDATPLIVFIQTQQYDQYQGSLLLINGTIDAVSFPQFGSSRKSEAYLTVAWNGNTVSWYNPSNNYGYQLNSSYRTYSYVAILDAHE